jgi:hypothetical protein
MNSCLIKINNTLDQLPTLKHCLLGVKSAESTFNKIF